MKLKHAENKWNIERQIHEEEVMKLKKETAEAGNKSGRNDKATCMYYLTLFCLGGVGRKCPR